MVCGGGRARACRDAGELSRGRSPGVSLMSPASRAGVHRAGIIRSRQYLAPPFPPPVVSFIPFLFAPLSHLPPHPFYSSVASQPACVSCGLRVRDLSGPARRCVSRSVCAGCVAVPAYLTHAFHIPLSPLGYYGTSAWNFLAPSRVTIPRARGENRNRN